ncbi:four helix bundle protein [Candidatus Woesebacteria bacterium]|nr:four helix bundle protein [Candidatus Woesebacteria bacterium]
MVNRTSFKFEELNVYKEALDFVDFIYEVTSSWPKEEIFGLTNQVRRASVSIALNIAEGSSRTRKDFRHFLDLARGSCYECYAILRIARNRNYIDERNFDKAYEFCNKIARMISALKRSLQ